MFALFRLTDGPHPRNRRRRESGAALLDYLLVKDAALGGYNEVALLTGGKPYTLPSIEVDTETLLVRRKGVSVTDAERLAEAIRALHQRLSETDGMVAVDVRLLSAESSRIHDDKDWWPRIFLDLRDRLVIRARTPEEAGKLMRTVFEIVHDVRFQDYSGWRHGEIVSGTQHYWAVTEDRIAVARVVAKMAYGVLRWRAENGWHETEQLERVRVFVRFGRETEFPGWVIPRSDVKSFQQWQSYHVVAVKNSGGCIRAIVCIFGACFEVELGAIEGAVERCLPIVAVSARDGSDTRLLGKYESEDLRQALDVHLK